MPHLKCLFHCGRQKGDNTSATKMLHQMSVWVVVVALWLVLMFYFQSQPNPAKMHLREAHLFQIHLMQASYALQITALTLLFRFGSSHTWPWLFAIFTRNVLLCSCVLRGPATILFISRDACSDSITKLFCVCFFYGISRSYRAICWKMGITQMCLCETKYPRGGIAPFWGAAEILFL